MTKIFDAVVERSGAGLRIRGKAEDGHPTKATNVDRVELVGGKFLGIRDGAAAYELVGA